MANRYYGVIPNTPENKRILDITMALDARRNVTNQPTYLWQVPLLSGNHRIKDDKSYTPMVGGGYMDIMDESEPMQRPRGMVSAFTQPPNQFILSGTSASYPYYNADELKIVNARKYGGGTKSGGAYDAETKRAMYEARNPKTSVFERMLKAQEAAKDPNNPINRWLENERNLGRANRAKPAIAIDPNSDVLLEGAGPYGAMFLSGAKTGAKYGAKYGAQAVKTGISVAKTGASAAVAIAKNPAFQAVVSEIANDKDVQKAVIDQVSSLIKGNKTIEDVKEEATETPVEGGRISRRKRGGMITNDDIARELLDAQNKVAEERIIAKAIIKDGKKREEILKPSFAQIASEKLIMDREERDQMEKSYKKDRKKIRELPSGLLTGRDSQSLADKFTAKLAAELAKERARQGEASGSGITDGRAKRAALVKKIMNEKGMKMIEASKYIKANNLY
jgi:hypothetical protein